MIKAKTDQVIKMLNMFISLGMRKSFLIKLKVIYAKRFVQDKYNQVLEVYG